MVQVPDHYSTLGVPHDASLTEIRRAYHGLALKYHPDKNPTGNDLFKSISVAYQVLSDGTQRLRYDHSIILAARTKNHPYSYHNNHSTSTAAYTKPSTHWRPSTAAQARTATQERPPSPPPAAASSSTSSTSTSSPYLSKEEAETLAAMRARHEASRRGETFPEKGWRHQRQGWGFEATEPTQHPWEKEATAPSEPAPPPPPPRSTSGTSAAAGGRSTLAEMLAQVRRQQEQQDKAASARPATASRSRDGPSLSTPKFDQPVWQSNKSAPTAAEEPSTNPSKLAGTIPRPTTATFAFRRFQQASAAASTKNEEGASSPQQPIPSTTATETSFAKQKQEPPKQQEPHYRHNSASSFDEVIPEDNEPADDAKVEKMASPPPAQEFKNKPPQQRPSIPRPATSQYPRNPTINTAAHPQASSGPTSAEQQPSKMVTPPTSPTAETAHLQTVTIPDDNAIARLSEEEAKKLLRALEHKARVVRRNILLHTMKK